jgi:hypothetical protein
VFRTTDGGKTWKDISGNLPQAPVNDLVPVGDDLLAATDVGVFLSRGVSKGVGREWLKVGTGLPNAPITELRWHAPTSTLFAANFGRGAFSVKLADLGEAGAAKGGRAAKKATPVGAASQPGAASAAGRAVGPAPVDRIDTRAVSDDSSLPGPAVPAALVLLLAASLGATWFARRH